LSGTDNEHVRDILDCIEATDRAEVTAQRYRHLVVAIVDAVKALSLDLREDHPAVPWSDLERLGDLLDPHDDDPDPQILRATIGKPLERLRSACRAILGEALRAGEDEP
jgi:uncharacterized protein with HEPN domain